MRGRLGGALRKKKRVQFGIRWKMLAIILTFVFLFSVVIWVFQIQMLNYFYQGVKYKEIDRTVELIKDAPMDNLRIIETVSERAEETYDDIWVYRVEKETVNEDRPIVFSEGSHDSHAVFLQREFDELYIEAKENQNKYIGVFSIKYFNPNSYYEFKIIEDNKGNSTGLPRVSRNIREVNAIQLNILPLEDGTELLIVQRSNLAPMMALVNTIQTQVLFTSGVLIIFSIILVILLSRMITKPIVNINNSAKCLAQGKYDIEFSGNNYREISELSDTLNYAAVELSKNDKLQKELISNISHDLRTPLTMIRGYSELMRDLPGENTPENFQVIIDEATRLAELVSGMLDLSKIQSGVRVPDKKLFCLTEIIKETLIRYEKLVVQENYKIDFDFDSDVYVYADSTMILQVIYNFINNAINYTGADKYVRVEQKLENGTVRISISDTGDGIEQEQLKYIWDRYYKVDKVHKRATVGTGLGLSIVKGVLEAHGASYGVTSTVGQGSTFWFELPAADPSEYDVELAEY